MNNFSEIKRPSQNFNQPNTSMADRMKIEMPTSRNQRHILSGAGLKTKNYGLKILAVLVVILLIGLAVKLFVFSDLGLAENKSEWQAIFLTNNEVYFGKVARVNKEVVVVQSIFYLQNKEALQQGAIAKTQTGDIALIKLGSELHGPMDEMRINKNQVLFVEDMKDESKIVKAIKDYLAK